jgi:carboxymethylenebutenolidase
MGHALLLTASLLAFQTDAKITAAKVKFTSGKVTVEGLEAAPVKVPGPGLLLVHGEFGLTPWVAQQARNLAAKGYHVLAIDLYGGELPKTVLDAHILERGLEDEKVESQLKAAVDYLAMRPGVRKDAIGILGWDMGGGHALDAAIHDQRLRAVVVCCGRLPTEANTVAKLQAPVLGLFAGKDQGISKTTIAQFQKAMAQAGKTATIHVYANCESGFMDPDSPGLTERPAAADIADAWSRIEKFLAAQLH